jgi:hypothetical protein
MRLVLKGNEEVDKLNSLLRVVMIPSVVAKGQFYIYVTMFVVSAFRVLMLERLHTNKYLYLEQDENYYWMKSAGVPTD